MQIIWLGHGSFRIEIADKVLLIDPWLSGNPMLPQALHQGAVDGATHIVITHGHADPPRAGHGHVLTSPGTAAIMRVRYGKNCAGTFQEQAPGTWVDHFGVRVQLVPAGHVLGSCQIVLEYAGWRVVAREFGYRSKRLLDGSDRRSLGCSSVESNCVQ